MIEFSEGVTKRKNGLFRAEIIFDGQSISLGLHRTESAANEAYNAAVSVKPFNDFEVLMSVQRHILTSCSGALSRYEGVKFCQLERKWYKSGLKNTAPLIESEFICALRY